MIRAFIAIELSGVAKTALEKLQSEFIKTEADIKWVRPENIHATLKFLGDISEEQQKKIKDILDNSLKGMEGFKFNLSGTGAFPNPNHPKIIWVGSTAETEMKTIAKVVDEKINKLGFPKELRAFKSHFTLGRIRSDKNKEKLIQQIKEFQEWQGPETFANGVCLFQSILTPQGSIYSLLHKTSLTIN